jgi:hypothetical protein
MLRLGATVSTGPPTASFFVPFIVSYSFFPPSAYSSVLNMEAARYFEMSVRIYQATQNHVTDGSNLALAVTLTLFLRTSPAI